MARRLPPFTAIRAFEATARHLSMTEAADELCVTPSAISHQIKALEAFLDTALLNRDGNRISLTLTGLSYRLHLSSLLDMLDDATRDIAERKDLRVLATPGFAARFLVPRLSRFKHAQMVRLKVSEGAPDTDFSRNGSDVVIQWGEGPVPDVAVEPLMESGRYPVIAPSLKLAEDISAPQDLLRVTFFMMRSWMHGPNGSNAPAYRFQACHADRSSHTASCHRLRRNADRASPWHMTPCFVTPCDPEAWYGCSKR